MVGPDQTPRQKTNLGPITMKPMEADGVALDQVAGSLDFFQDQEGSRVAGAAGRSPTVLRLPIPFKTSLSRVAA